MLPASYLQPFFRSAVQCQANSQILATAADFQCFLGEHSTPPEWVYLPRERLGIDILGTGPMVNGPIENYQTFVKQTSTEQGNWPSILRSFSRLQAKETRTVYGFERFLRTQGGWDLVILRRTGIGFASGRSSQPGSIAIPIISTGSQAGCGHRQ